VGKPDSTKAADLLAKAFPPTREELKHQVSDVVVVRSERYAVDAPAFRSFVAAFVHRARATGEVLAVQSYLDGDRSLVSRDRHATLVQLLVGSDSAVKPVVSLVQEEQRTHGFS